MSSQEARSCVIKAALHLAASDWGNDWDTPDAVAGLELAHDMFDDAVGEYIRVLHEETTAGVSEA